MPRRGNKNLQGIGLMLPAMLFFQAMDAMAKWLVKVDISALQVIAVRSRMMLAMILLVLGMRGKLSLLRTQEPTTHALRGLLAFFAPLFYFTALKDLPLADATVIFFSASFILTAASVLFFAERVGWHRWAEVVVRFVGAGIIVCSGLCVILRESLKPEPAQ